MILACLDTSTNMASFSLFKDEEEIIAVSRECHKGASKLLPWISEMIKEKGFSTSEVNEWRVGIGPGSFTGMRVGIAFIKGICYASGASFRGVNSGYGYLLPLVECGLDTQKVSVLHDGRRKEVIANTFGFIEGKWEEAGTEVIKIADLPVRKENLGVLMTAMPKESFDDDLQVKIHFSEAIKAGAFQKVFLDPLSTQDEMDLSCEPIYVRPPVFL